MLQLIILIWVGTKVKLFGKLPIKANGNLGYTLYEFKDGNDISEVDNL